VRDITVFVYFLFKEHKIYFLFKEHKIYFLFKEHKMISERRNKYSTLERQHLLRRIRVGEDFDAIRFPAKRWNSPHQIRTILDPCGKNTRAKNDGAMGNHSGIAAFASFH